MNTSEFSAPMRERWLVAAALAGFFLLNLATAMRSPTVWSDEVMYTDAAANWHLGHGFTSTAWFAQASGDFWAGNVPLHAVTLRAWLGLFGFSAVSVRAINYAWVALIAALLWAFAKRHALIAQPWLRISFVVLVWCGSGMGFSYRSGRPDMVGAAVAVGLVWCAQWPAGGWRTAGIFFFAALLPWAGLQLIPFTVVLGGIAWAVLGVGLATALLVAAGMAAGGIGLAALYLANGVWPGFLLSIGRFAGSTSLASKLAAIATPYRQDPSSTVLLLTLVGIWIYHRLGRPARNPRPLVAGIWLGLIMPAALHVSGKFAPYYAWMSFLPMSVCLCAYLDASQGPRVLQFTALAAMGAAAIIGLPARLAVAARHWSERDYDRVAKFVTENIRAEDRVYCVYQAYYPAKQTARNVYLPEYLQLMSADERRNTTVLVAPPSDFANTSRQLGGTWEPGPRFSLAPAAEKTPQPLAKPYDLQIFRRPASRAQSP